MQRPNRNLFPTPAHPFCGISCAKWVLVLILLIGLFLPLDWLLRFSILWKMPFFIFHTLEFGIIAWCLDTTFPARFRGWKIFIVLAVLAGFIEIIQPFFGRDRDELDFFFGLLGAGIMVLPFGCAQRQFFPRASALLIVFVSIFLGSFFFFKAEQNLFPVLVSAEKISGRFYWETHAVSLTRELADGKKMLKVSVVEMDDYPGIFRIPAQSDWSGKTRLVAEIFWPHDDGRRLWIRFDDKPNNPPYADRVQEDFPLQKGWNQLVMDFHKYAQTPNGRAVGWGSIHTFGLFMPYLPVGEYFGIGKIWLE